ncbi:MAG: transcription-repair coupling factor [Bacillota bacterium]
MTAIRHHGLIQLTVRAPVFASLQEGIRRGQVQALYGLSGSQIALWLAGIMEATGAPLVAITPGLEEAKRLVLDMNLFLSHGEAGYLPPYEILPYEVYAKSSDLAAQRISVLEGVLSGRVKFLALPAAALMQPLMPPGQWKEAVLQLTLGQRVEWEALLARLVFLGYQRAEVVEIPGYFSVRGGIIDVFPFTSPQPYRIEFFDDEVDSIRLFDPVTQRSLENLREAVFHPAREVFLTLEALSRCQARLSADAAQQVKRLLKRGAQEAARRLEEKTAGYLEQLAAGVWNEGLDQFRQLLYPEPADLWAYFSSRPVVVMEEAGRVKEALAQAALETGELFSHLLETGSALPLQAEHRLDFSQMLEMLAGRPLICFSVLPKSVPGLNPQNILGMSAKVMHPFMGKTEMLAEELKSWRQAKNSVVLLAGDEKRAGLLRDTLWDHGVEAAVVEDLAARPLPGQVTIIYGTLSKGFEIPQWKLVIISDSEMFGRQKRPKPRRSFKEGSRIAAFTDLKVGDYVVHVQHGIGRYRGIEKLEAGGIQKDYLVVQYAGEDRLYVPTEQISLIQKYIGGEGHGPKLNRLGGSEWARTKKKVKESVQAMADDLLALYAAREAAVGFSFSPDTVWQREFEAMFPYTETPDQLRAIEATKKDMESPRPMDRLLCGDVGYGKTEVALRAAFKAVMDGKQVALLVPTTILAQQHYHTFKERMEAFPFSLGLLSRFRSPKEQEEVVKGLQLGTIDIVIGTHRLLSPDVKFKNLGLVVVDEEQRFGVAHKERLKQLCHHVDVLTLTATPIPRTLYMSMVGVRDISVIETPPEDRFPVQTYVVEYSPELVREAIRRELARGGQVFFVHNRILDMERMARHLQELLPDARIAVAHGQMKEERLERVMLEFMDGHIDVLVCTSIVENGLDISNVNTLIVDEADHLGLSQLYQLRGRVGRTNRLAYAYFTYRKERVLSEQAEKRLSAIREFTEFGSGFKLAMRDLEIRGAGNILGSEQHGHMMAVGFELYCQLLEEAVKELRQAKGLGIEPEQDQEPASPVVELSVNAYIPDAYIRESQLKIEVYQRLMAAGNLEEVISLEAETEDRFGPAPKEVRNLMAMGRIKALAKVVDIARVEQQKGEIRMVFGPSPRLRGDKLMQLAAAFPRRLSFSSAGGLTVTIRSAGIPQQELLPLVESVLKEIKLLAG